MKNNPTAQHSGFTLLEVMMALLLMAAIAGMVFGISRTSLNLGQGIVKAQAEEMEQQAFFEFLSARFASMSGNARMDLIREDNGGAFLSDLTLQEVPMSFTWGGQDQLAKAVQISTVQTRSGFLDIVLRYYENEILEGSADFDSTAEPEEPYAEIVLLRDVYFFEWYVYDANDLEEPLYEWDEQGRLPLQVELFIQIGVDGEEMRHVFWLPPKQNPETIMRQMSLNNDAEGQQPQTPGQVGPGVVIPGNGGAPNLTPGVVR